jgi:ATP-binding cassette, subfamily B, bacterial
MDFQSSFKRRQSRLTIGSADRQKNLILNSWRLWREARPYCWRLAALFSLGLLGTPLALLTPVPVKIAVDSVIGSRPLPPLLEPLLPSAVKGSQGGLLILAALLVVALALLSQLREFGTSVLSAYTSEQMLLGFRAKLFGHVQRISLSYHDSRGTADSIYRIQYDATALQNILISGVVPFVSSAITLISMIYVTAYINGKFALIGLAVSPFLLLVSRYYRRELRGVSRSVKKLESSALSVVHEVLGSVRVVRAFGQEDREQQRFLQKSNEGMRARIHQTFIEGGYGITVALLTAGGMAAVLYIGVLDVRSGKLTLGNLLLVMSYLGQLYSPLRTVGKKMATMQSHLVSAERAFALLDEAPQVEERANASHLRRASGSIAFNQVSFSYDGGHEPVLQDISFEIRPGECVGIIGATGAGKTTLVSLLTRFFDPTSGEILLDGVDLRDYKLADLRNQFAIVLQEPILFSSSIAENIAYARPHADRSEIVAAAKAANAHDFILNLPRGYDTLVGERGMRLSGGERQRISIARAFLKNSPILILDEPTSSIDVRTEADLLEAMERLTRGRTTCIITHRSSALKFCNTVLRVDQRRVVPVNRDNRAARQH